MMATSPESHDSTSSLSAPWSREIVLTRVFDAPRQLVFEAWSTAEHLRNWFCPDGYTVPFCTCEFREGGRFEVCCRASDGQDYWWKSHYTEIVRLERIAFASTVSIGDGPVRFEAIANVTFSAQHEKTLVRVHQSFALRDPTAAWMIDGAEPGWIQGLDRLAALLMEMKERA